MATKLFLIIGKNKVYGTYVKTICAEISFSNQEEKETAIMQAKSIVFDYAESFGSVVLETIKNQFIETSNDVFLFLENK